MMHFLKVSTFFREVESSERATRYVPRSVQIDLEAGVFNRVCHSAHDLQNKCQIL